MAASTAFHKYSLASLARPANKSPGRKYLGCMDFTKNEHPLVCDALTELPIVCDALTELPIVCDALTELPINENQDEAE